MAIYVGAGGVKTPTAIYVGAGGVKTVSAVYVGVGSSPKKVWPSFADYGDKVNWISWGSVEDGLCDEYYRCNYNNQSSVSTYTIGNSTSNMRESVYNDTLYNAGGRVWWWSTNVPIDLGLYQLIRLYGLQMWTTISNYHIWAYPIFSVGSDPSVCPFLDSKAVYPSSYTSYGNDFTVDLAVTITDNTLSQIYPKIGFWYRCNSSGSNYTSGWGIPSEAAYSNGGNIRMYYNKSDYSAPSSTENWTLTY